MPSSREPIIVLSPRLSRSSDKAVWSADVRGPRSGSIEFTIGGIALAESEAHNDAFVLPAYLHALHSGHPIHYDFPVSHRLAASLNDAIGPLLVKFAPDLFPETVTVSAKDYLWGPAGGKRVPGSATGMSCGLDSFATVHYTQAFPQPSGRRLAALALFDVGNHSPLGGPDANLCIARSRRATAVAAQLGLPLVDIQSNVGEWVPGGFARLHTLRNASAAYLTYPLVGTYVYSNGVRIDDTTLAAKDTAYIDALLLPLLSTAYLEFIQGTPSWGAPEKIQSILQDPIAQSYLNVCYFEGENCGICEKCLRRALLIDSYGRLEDFRKVLDRRVFHANKDWYIGYVLMRAPSSPVMHEMAEHLHKVGYLTKSALYYRCAWILRRIENRILRLMCRPRRPL